MARGSLRSRTPGSWQLLFHVNGKQKSKTVTGTKREAERMLTEIVRSIDQGTYEEAPKKVITVGQVVKEWLADVKTRRAATTHSRYENAARRWVLVEFGGFALSALGPRQVQSVYKRWAEDGLAPCTIRMNHQVLSAALSYAVRMELIERNAASAVTPPSPESLRERGTLTDEEVSLLLREAPKHLYGAQVILALATGMRLGEICGLRWEFVDTQWGKLEVRHSAARVTGEGIIVKGPKTKSSRRVVVLPDVAIRVLADLPVDGAYVFGGDQPLSPPTVSAGASRLLRGLGLDATMHGLRHTHASLLNRLGGNPKAVQARLGHSGLAETMLTYTHLLPHQQDELVSLLNTVLNDKSDTSPGKEGL